MILIFYLAAVFSSSTLSASASSAISSSASGKVLIFSNVTFAAGSIGEKMSNFLSSGETAVGKTFQFNNLTFATGSAGITPETFGEVQNLAAVLSAYPNVKVKIIGHTDNTGNADANLALSAKRAEMVMSKLTNLGIDASRMTAEGVGQTMPVASNDTEEGRLQNRRIEVVIVE